jgi:hypothetical protein
MSRSFKKESRSSSVETAEVGDSVVEVVATGAAASTTVVAVVLLEVVAFLGVDLALLVTAEIESPGFKYMRSTSFTKALVSSSHAL